jgi:DNA-binding response OmpR family regulator
LLDCIYQFIQQDTPPPSSSPYTTFNHNSREVIAAMKNEGWVVGVADDWLDGQARAGGLGPTGSDYQSAALYAIEEFNPDALILDIHFGERREDRMKGLEIIREIVAKFKGFPILVLTRYSHGPEREMVVPEVFTRWESPIDFIDKLATPAEIVLRLTRLMGMRPQKIYIGSDLYLDTLAEAVFVIERGIPVRLREISGAKYKILRDLIVEWQINPGSVVSTTRLVRHFVDDDTHSTTREERLKIRISESRRILANRLNVDDKTIILSQRGLGYYLDPALRSLGLRR